MAKSTSIPLSKKKCFYVYFRSWPGFSDTALVDKHNQFDSALILPSLHKEIQHWRRHHPDQVADHITEMRMRLDAKSSLPPTARRRNNLKRLPQHNETDPQVLEIIILGGIAGWFTQGGYRGHQLGSQFDRLAQRYELLSVDNRDMAKRVVDVLNDVHRESGYGIRLALIGGDKIESIERGRIDTRCRLFETGRSTEPEILAHGHTLIDHFVAAKQTALKTQRLSISLEREVYRREERQRRERNRLMRSIAASDKKARDDWDKKNLEYKQNFLTLYGEYRDNNYDAKWRKWLVSLMDKNHQAERHFYDNHCAKPDTLSKLRAWVVFKLVSLEERDRPAKEGLEAYRDACAFVANIRTGHPDLASPPPPTSDPYVGLTAIREWCNGEHAADTTGWWKLTEAAEEYANDAGIKRSTAKTAIRDAAERGEIVRKGTGNEGRYEPGSVALFILKKRAPELEAKETNEQVQALVDKHVKNDEW